MRVKKVLLVDDSPTDQMVVIRILASQNFDIVTASNGEEAIEKAKRESPDCILMDVVMPGINGFQATRALAKDPATKDIPVIILSSKGQQTDKIWGERQGAKGYLVKPVSESDLISKLEEL
jgi:twitching motility two-component system response regulator PilH